jgi:hypothetical protein
MAKSREQLEREINGTIYFSITGDNTEALRKSELYKLSALVFEYCNKYVYVKSGKASKFGEEIFNCTRDCLNNFKPEKEVPFVHYLNAALSRSIRKAEFREENAVQKLGQDCIQTQKGKKFSLLSNQRSSLQNPEEEIIKKEEIMEELDTVEKVFRNKQDRVKKLYLRKLVTHEYFDKIVRFLGTYSFVDMEMVKNVLLNKKALPSQKEIAETFGKLEADASRTINKFKREVERKLEKKC